MTYRLLLSIATTVALAALLGGCAGLPQPTADYDRAWTYAAQPDSLGLTAFRSLPLEPRQSRRTQAAAWRDAASDAGRIEDRLRALNTAAGLAPDDVDVWLELVDLSRALGDHARAFRCLISAEACLLTEPPDRRAALRLRVAQLRAWIYRARGDRVHAQAWADSAVRRSPEERETLILSGLTKGDIGDSRGAKLVADHLQRRAPSAFDWRWIRGAAEAGLGNDGPACYWFEVGPDRLFSAPYNQDRGLIYERLDDRTRAGRFYRHAFNAWGVRDHSAVRKHDVMVTRTGGESRAWPVWIAFERHFVAGSPYAFALYALERRREAVDEAARARWTDAAVEGLGLSMRFGVEPLMARARRGHLYAELDLWSLARGDLREALRGYEALGIEDPGTLYWLGVMNNKQDRSRRALELLERAVAAAPGFAEAWSALGYARLMTGKHAEGMAALDHALELDSELATAWYNRGLARYQRRDWAGAVADLERAAQLAPGNQELIALLQQAQIRLRRQEQE